MGAILGGDIRAEGIIWKVLGLHFRFLFGEVLHFAHDEEDLVVIGHAGLVALFW